MRIGDVVKLKSGSPNLTIQRIYSDLSSLRGWVEVVWFDDKQELQSAYFENKALVLVTIP